MGWGMQSIQIMIPGRPIFKRYVSKLAEEKGECSIEGV